MTPNEKANDLVYQYKTILMDEDTDCGNEILCTLISIKAAKITANEIIKDLPLRGVYKKKYWKRVIKELNNFTI